MDPAATAFTASIDYTSEAFRRSKGYAISNHVEGQLTTAWDKMEKQSKSFMTKEKYRFYDSDKYKPLIRNGLPYCRRKAMWRRLCDSETQKLRAINFDDVFARTFRWPGLDPAVCLGLRASPDMETLPFAVQHPPLFGVTQEVADRIPTYFWLTPQGVRQWHILLCMLAEMNPDLTVAPMLPAFVAGLLGTLSPEEVFHAAMGLIFLSRDANRVETRLHYFKFTQLDHESMIRTMVHFLRGKAPDIVRKFENLQVDLFSILNRLFCTFFMDVIPYCIGLRVFDAFVNEGHKVMYRLGLGLIIDVLGATIAAAVQADQLVAIFNQVPEMIQGKDLARIFDCGFEYSLAREVVQDVEGRHMDPDRPLPQLRTYQGKRTEVRIRPAVFPSDGGSILSSPTYWETVFGYFANPHQVAPFTPKRIDRIFNTTFNGWSLNTLYRVTEEALKDFQTKHRVRGLLLIKGFVTDGEGKKQQTPAAVPPPAPVATNFSPVNPSPPVSALSNNGHYLISPAVAKDKVLGCRSRETANGTDIVLWEKDGDVNQHWKAISKGGDGKLWSFTPLHAEGQAQLDAGYDLDKEQPGQGTERVHLWDLTTEVENPNQQWRLEPVVIVPNMFFIRRIHDGMTLEVERPEGGSFDNGVTLRCRPFTGDDVQQFFFSRIDNDPAPPVVPMKDTDKPIERRESVFAPGSVTTIVGAVLHPLPRGCGATQGPASYGGSAGTFVFQMYEDGTNQVYYPALKNPLPAPPAAATLAGDASPTRARNDVDDHHQPAEEGRTSTSNRDVELVTESSPITTRSGQIPPAGAPSPDSSSPHLDQGLDPQEERGLPTTINRYFILTEKDHLTVGGGSVGGPAIRLADDLQSMQTFDCETFQSPAFTTAAVDHSGKRSVLTAGTIGSLYLDVTSVEVYAIQE